MRQTYRADAMAAQSVLAVASLAAQALADVRLPYGQTPPLSLFCLTIASSGDRKTSADSEAMAPVRMREKQLREVFEPRAKDHAVALAAWRGNRQQIERKKADVETRRFELQALGAEPAEPEAPIKPVLTLGESTAEGLARHMPVLPGAVTSSSGEVNDLVGRLSGEALPAAPLLSGSANEMHALGNPRVWPSWQKGVKNTLKTCCAARRDDIRSNIFK